ncbi:hypothetical protein AX14_003831 [Amanita brunnescens Koide BX004]|nr:hypothetical protein AX14_003831 [Amanita brunnescens Koide BX004]
MKHSSAMFSGCVEYLQRLRDYFGSNVGLRGQRKSFLLYGLGGIGKTQICLKFTEENVDLFSNIFWIDASSKITIELGLMQIALENNAPQEAKQSPRSVLQWISQKTNWLVIYDGADGHYQIVENFLPPGNGGNILITSRNVGLNRISLTSQKVQNMEEKEAASLVLKSAGVAAMSDHNCYVARKLASQLSGIPIALDQAGAYMLTTQCSIDDYLELYTKHKHELLSNSDFKGSSDYDTTTYGTWDISMKKIEKMAEKDGEEAVPEAQSAIKILRIFGFLDHANIPEELFKNAAENYMKRDVDNDVKSKSHLPLSIRLLDHQTLFLSEEGIWEKLKFLAGIQVLISFSLIEAHSQLYSMHLLVHSWSRHRVPRTEVMNLYHKTTALLSCSVNLDYRIDNYIFCRFLAPHIRSNALHALELQLKNTYYEDEYENFTLVFHHVGSWDEMEKLLLVTAKWRTAVLGAEHPNTSVCISMLASTYRNLGRWDEAEKLETDIMNARKEKLGSDHPATLTIMANLASTYRNQGRWDEAEKLEVDVMNAIKAKLGG